MESKKSPLRSLLLITVIIPMTFLLLSSCNDDFINRTPVSSVSTADYYQNGGQIEGALTAAYHQFYIMANQFVAINAFRSDNFQNDQYIEFAYANNNFSRYSSPIWGGSYELIYRSNQVINNIQNVDMDGKQQALAEAQFLRGYAYFWLVRVFGKAPIVTKELTQNEALNKSRESISSIYTQIEKDLEFAVNNLSENSPKGRANKYVAESILAKVYIMQSGYPINEDKYNEALPLLEDIINSGKYHLEDNYEDIFTLEGENGPEIIWSAVMDSDQKGLQHSQEYMIDPNAGARTISNPEVADGEDPILGNLWLSFESGDIRKTVSLDSVSMDSRGNLQNSINNSKYKYGYVEGVGWTSDYILVRYANILLLYAEALHKTGSSSIIGNKWSIINRIRNRAGLEDLSNNKNFMDKLMIERRHEFVWEGVRWFDLVRTNTFVQELKKVGHSDAADFWKLVPIPDNEMTKMEGKWENNEGYN